jgi:PAS domain S-box-containing protein
MGLSADLFDAASSRGEASLEELFAECSGPTDALLGLLEAMPDGMLVADTEGRIVLVNVLLEKLSGFERTELIGEPVEILVPDRVKSTHRSHRADYYASGLPSRGMGTGLEIFLGRKDGSQVAVDVSLSSIELGESVLVLGAVRDVTERRRTEAVIRENERRWRTLLENVGLLVVGLDEKGLITYTNPFLEELCGYSVGELVGRNWFALLPEGEVSTVRGVFDGLMKSDGPADFNNRIQVKGGGQRMVAWHNTVLRDSAGRPVGTLSIGEDITQRERARASLEGMNEIAVGILENRPLEEVFDVIAQRSRALMDSAVATVVTRAADGRMLETRVVDGEDTNGSIGATFLLEDSLCELVMNNRRTLSLDDISLDPRAHQPLTELGVIGPALLAPLAVEEHSFGALLVGRRRGARQFNEEDITLLEIFSNQASLALEHARFQEERQRIAVLVDRERIARDLHDGVIQGLFATGMSLQAGLAVADDLSSRRLNEAVGAIDEAISELRNHIFSLQPTSSNEVVGTLSTLGEEFEQRTGVTTVVDIDPDAVAAIEPISELIQFAREALSNVARHARATTCRFSVVFQDEGILVEIDDDGRGFDLDHRPRAGQGLGNLAKRAANLGAHLTIDSHPKAGTTVRAAIPALRGQSASEDVSGG